MQWLPADAALKLYWPQSLQAAVPKRTPHVRLEQHLGEQAAILTSSTSSNMQLKQHLR